MVLEDKNGNKGSKCGMRQVRLQTPWLYYAETAKSQRLSNGF
jgi:hypothetical protein